MNNIPPPQPLNLTGNVDEAWKKFKQRFELYLKAIEADKKSDAQKIALLLTVAGPEVIEVFNTLTFTEEDKGKYDVVVQKLEEYCIPRKNETYERYVFRSRVQRDGENCEQFITDLKIKSQTCNFGALKDSLIRDQIVIGISDKKVKERLLREKDLDLEKAIHICQISELAKTQMKTLEQTEGETVDVSVLNKQACKKPTQGKQGGSKPKNKVPDKSSNDNKKVANPCQRCGHTHDKGKCFAYNKICHRCHKKHHFQSMCRSKHVETLTDNTEQDTDYDEDMFLGAIHDTKTGKNTDWMTKASVNGTEVTFKLDTGAQVNVLPVKCFNKLTNKPELKQKNITIRSYTGEKIPIKGVCYARLKCQGIDLEEEVMFVVVAHEYQAILGLEACEKYNLVTRVNTVNKDSTIASNNPSENVSPIHNQVLNEFADVFKGIGCLPVTYKIKLKADATPVIHAARKVPVSLKDKLEKELTRLTELNIIRKIEEPTEWVNSLVIIEKANKDLRLCLDPKDLNEYIMREHYRIPTRSEITANMAGAKFFSKLDASSGFWQIPLDEESSKLCTFNTPYGRYCFLRMPFGISSAPEVFHRTIEQLFEGMDGVKSIHDDIIVWGTTEKEHDERLHKTLSKAQEVGLKLNVNKCRFRVQELTFLGDKITPEGVQPDPAKVNAIRDMPQPTCKAELQRYFGMVNFLGKFVPNLSAKTVALRRLLEDASDWQWQPEHEAEWKQLSEFLTTEPVLKFHDPLRKTKVSSDASKDGLGAVLLQDHDGNWKPVAYASRAMTQAEKRYAQIEKETLGMVFACEKFHEYIYGVPNVIAETDHKPLIAISKKNLCDTTPRIQRLMLRLQRYDLKFEYLPGKYLVVADTLSRASLSGTETTSDTEEDVEIHVNMVKASFPITDSKWQEIANATASDTELQNVINQLNSGWEQGPFPKPYYHFRGELSVVDGVLLKSNRIIIPTALRQDMLRRIHEGHMGIEKCRRRARQLLYWPNMNRDIEDVVSKCSVCQKYRYSQQKEPLKPHEVPEEPWVKVGADIFQLNGKDYLLVIDYMSNYPEVALLSANSKTSTVVNHMKSFFARHGIPSIIVTDGGPQFASDEFDAFVKSYGITHDYSDPYYPKGNGQAEKGVQIVENLLRKSLESNEDTYLALLAYRTTPLECGKSPAELLMNRQLRTTLPNVAYHKPQTNGKAKQERSKQKLYYDRYAKPLRPLENNETVRVRGKKCWDKKAVVCKKQSGRSYLIKTEDGGTYVRNRIHLLPTKEKFVELPSHADEPTVTSTPTNGETVINTPPTGMTVDKPVMLRRSQRQIHKPQRLIEEI